MKITKNCYVGFKLKITDDEGEVLEETTDSPDYYIHGQGEALEAIEKALEGKTVGFLTTLNLSMDEAFGDYDETLVTIVNKEDFDHPDELEIGLEFISDTEDDNSSDAISWRIIDIDENDITLDANHPYAGLNLVFDIEVMEVREATPEELNHTNCDCH